MANRTQTTPAASAARTASRPHLLLRGLEAARAGCSCLGPGWFRATSTRSKTAFIYCVKGRGWCETAGQRHTLHPGDLLVLPPQTAARGGPYASNPWTLYWVEASGALLPEYLAALGISRATPRTVVGEDPAFARLLHEVCHCLQPPADLVRQIRASHALAHLLATWAEGRQAVPAADGDVLRKVAEAIIYMTEHVHEPVRVATLARLASLSPAYFSSLFKLHTGSSPRDYLRLLRIHQACQLLRSTGLSVKEIAGRLGYDDAFHFSRQFKASQAVSPSQYRLTRPD